MCVKIIRPWSWVRKSKELWYYFPYIWKAGERLV